MGSSRTIRRGRRHFCLFVCITTVCAYCFSISGSFHRKIGDRYVKYKRISSVACDGMQT